MHTLLEQLRCETEPQHRELEAALDIKRCLADRHAYVGFLAKMHGIYAPLEERLAGDSDLCMRLPSLPDRRKAPYLRQDLETLGSLAEPAVCGNLPPDLGRFGNFGILYVLEGSTLGGQVIRRMIPEGHFAASASRFFEGYGSRTAERWRETVQVLGLAELAPHTRAITATADATFRSLMYWFVGGNEAI